MKPRFFLFFRLTCFLAFLILWNNAALAQLVTVNPKFTSKTCKESIIKKIEITNDFTVVHYTYTSAADNFKLYTHNSHYLLDKKSGEQYELIKKDGIPFYPESILLTLKGEMVNYTLYFRKLSPGVELIDDIESNNSNAFNFYGLKVHNPAVPVEQKVAKADTIDLQIRFGKGIDKIHVDDYEKLDMICEMLKNNVETKIELQGHTEMDQEDYTEQQKSSNLRLSESRVQRVKAYLVHCGVDAARINTKAFGGSMPVSQTDPSLNRRVIMIVTQ